MGKSVIPSSDAQFANFVSNFGARLSGVATSLGLAAADALAVSNDGASMQNAVMDQLAKTAAARSSTKAKDLLRTAVEKRVRTMIGRVKKQPAYTQAVGEQLGIVAPITTSMKALAASTQGARPDLSGLVQPDGKVAVKFAKNGFTGVVVYCRRGSETEFTLLGQKLRSPLLDERPNLIPGQPETREYRGVYLDVDTPAGQVSDTLSVTVPATLAAAGGAEAPGGKTPLPAA